MIYNIKGVQVVTTFEDCTEEEAAHYVDYVLERAQAPPTHIEVIQCEDGKVDLNYELRGPKFERIRRITGYLTGSIDSWNNSKRSEEHDRVKHEVAY